MSGEEGHSIASALVDRIMHPNWMFDYHSERVFFTVNSILICFIVFS